MTRRRLILALLVTVAKAALGEAPDQVLISYQASIDGRQISGVSHSMHWSATQLADGSAQVRVRVPIGSFDSGHPRLDALAREILQADRYPFVEIEGAVHQGRFDGALTLHGVSRPLVARVQLTSLGSQVVVDTSFTIDLREFGLPAPPVDPRVTVDFVARLSADPKAVLAAGAINSR